MVVALTFLSDYGPALAAFAAFAVFHSVCAHEPFKDALARVTGRFFVDHFWRAAYCALSLAALYNVISALLWARNLDHNIWLFVYPDWLWSAITILHLGSVALIYVAFVQSDYLEFLGIKQAWHGALVLVGARTPRAPALFGTDRLVVSGVYRWIRHPMLSGGLLFLLTSGPSLNNLVYTGMYLIYMVIGGYYEERRLIHIFSHDYLRYRERVGAFFPRLRPRLAG